LHIFIVHLKLLCGGIQPKQIQYCSLFSNKNNENHTLIKGAYTGIYSSKVWIFNKTQSFSDPSRSTVIFEKAQIFLTYFVEQKIVSSIKKDFFSKVPKNPKIFKYRSNLINQKKIEL
jgi:hypothetical protein